MTSPRDDLSDDGLSTQSVVVANDFISDTLTRRWFRAIALGAALLTLFVLLGTMWTIVNTFLAEFRALAVDAQVPLAAATHVATGATSAAAGASAPASATAAAPVAANAPHVWVSLGSFTTSIAALVTALVVAATVLAIALVRASFTLTARGDHPEPAAADDPEDAPVTLPAAEFVKAFGESLQTALKGVQGLPRA